jgi:hypothetical protein
MIWLLLIPIGIFVAVVDDMHRHKRGFYKNRKNTISGVVSDFIEDAYGITLEEFHKK